MRRPRSQTGRCVWPVGSILSGGILVCSTGTVDQITTRQLHISEDANPWGAIRMDRWIHYLQNDGSDTLKHKTPYRLLLFVKL